MVEYRHEQWSSLLALAREAFGKFSAEHDGGDVGDLPLGGRSVFRISSSDVRLEGEFEATLFAVRTALDILARVVAASRQGLEHVHSYGKLAEVLARNSPTSTITALVADVATSWFQELRDRRDNASHYVGLSIESVLEIERAVDGERRRSELFVRIPKHLKKGYYVSVWHDFVPVIGSTTKTSQGLTLPDGRHVEAHALYDGRGQLILRRNGALPEPEEMIDGSQYVEQLIANFMDHTCSVLEALHSERVASIPSPKPT